MSDDEGGILPKNFPPELVAVEKLRIEADTVQLLAEARKFNAEALKLEHEASVASRMSTGARIAEDRELDKRRRELLSDDELRIYRFNGGVSAASCNTCIQTFALWHRLDTEAGQGDRPYKLVLNSPGGEILSGFGLFDYLRFISASGHHLTTEGFGLVASMAAVLFQVGDTRRIAPGTSYMIHSASFGVAGQIEQVEDTLDWVKALQDRIYDILAERSTLTRAKIVKSAERKDWTVLGPQVVKFGFADELIGG